MRRACLQPRHPLGRTARGSARAVPRRAPSRRRRDGGPRGGTPLEQPVALKVILGGRQATRRSATASSGRRGPRRPWTLTTSCACSLTARTTDCSGSRPSWSRRRPRDAAAAVRRPRSRSRSTSSPGGDRARRRARGGPGAPRHQARERAAPARPADPRLPRGLRHRPRSMPRPRRPGRRARPARRRTWRLSCITPGHRRHSHPTSTRSAACCGRPDCGAPPYDGTSRTSRSSPPTAFGRCRSCRVATRGRSRSTGLRTAMANGPRTALGLGAAGRPGGGADLPPEPRARPLAVVGPRSPRACCSSWSSPVGR